MQSAIHKLETFFLLAATKTGYFLQVWLVSRIYHVRFPLPLWTKLDQLTSVSASFCCMQDPLGNGTLPQKNVFLLFLSETSQSWILAIEIFAWLLPSFPHAASEWTWLLLATPTNILVSSPKIEYAFEWFSRGERENAMSTSKFLDEFWIL